MDAGGKETRGGAMDTLGSPRDDRHQGIRARLVIQRRERREREAARGLWPRLLIQAATGTARNPPDSIQCVVSSMGGRHLVLLQACNCHLFWNLRSMCEQRCATSTYGILARMPNFSRKATVKRLDGNVELPRHRRDATGLERGAIGKVPRHVGALVELEQEPGPQAPPSFERRDPAPRRPNLRAMLRKRCMYRRRHWNTPPLPSLPKVSNMLCRSGLEENGHERARSSRARHRPVCRATLPSGLSRNNPETMWQWSAVHMRLGMKTLPCNEHKDSPRCNQRLPRRARATSIASESRFARSPTNAPQAPWSVVRPITCPNAPPAVCR